MDHGLDYSTALLPPKASYFAGQFLSQCEKELQEAVAIANENMEASDDCPPACYERELCSQSCSGCVCFAPQAAYLAGRFPDSFRETTQTLCSALDELVGASRADVTNSFKSHFSRSEALLGTVAGKGAQLHVPLGDLLLCGVHHQAGQLSSPFSACVAGTDSENPLLAHQKRMAALGRKRFNIVQNHGALSFVEDEHGEFQLSFGDFRRAIASIVSVANDVAKSSSRMARAFSIAQLSPDAYLDLLLNSLEAWSKGVVSANALHGPRDPAPRGVVGASGNLLSLQAGPWAQ